MLNRIIFIALLATGMASCTNEQVASNENNGKIREVSIHDGVTFYGKEFDIKNAITGEQLRQQMATVHECNGVISGKVADVCKKEGCWINLDLGNNYMMQVSLHKFRVPNDCEGKTAYLAGKAYMDTTSVEKLRDFAEDAGKPISEVEAITQPKVEMIFEANGVGLK
jgi:hypothetical protein